MKKLRNLIAGILSVCMLCPISANAEENNVLYGDANVDGVVDICDITALKRHLIGTEKLSDKGIENCGFFNNTVDVKTLGQMMKYMIKDVEDLQFSYYDDGIYDVCIPFDKETLQNKPIHDTQVWVEIKHQYSCFTYEWTPEDFKGIENISEIHDLTVFDEDEADRYPNNKCLVVYLEETGEDKVYKMIEDIEKSGLAMKVYPVINDIPNYD